MEGILKPEEIKHDAGQDFDPIELFRTFKKFDRN
jgi:hypothetical protein